MTSQRPRYLALLARLLVRSSQREFIIGDLDELYARRVRSRGRLRASLAYMRDVIGSALSGWGSRPPGGRIEDRSRRTAGWGGDVQHALRSLRRRPGFAAMVVATLALGVGPAAAVFAMVEQLLLRPLPGVPRTDQAGYLVLGQPGNPEGLSLPDFEELRHSATLLEGVASYGLTSPIVSIGAGRPVSALANLVYGDYFRLLGVEPAEGRLLEAEDTHLDADPLVAVIAESLRNRLFGPEEEVVGRTVQINGHPVEIIGVAGGGFSGAERGLPTELWLPHGALNALVGFPLDGLRGRSSARHDDLLVLPRPGVAPEAAEAQVRDVLERLAEAHPEDAEKFAAMTPTLFPGLHSTPVVREITARTLRMMAWAAALILAISCANVANLLLFRNLVRRGALATRRALGASTGRLARQHLVESLMLGLLGGAVGIAVAWLVALPFRGERLPRMPALEGFTLGWETAAFVVVAAVATTLVFGIVPAILAGRFDLGAALVASRVRGTGRVGPLRTALSAGQIALTLALLVGGLLMVRTVQNLRAVETGLDIEGVVATFVDVPEGLDSEAYTLQRDLLEAIEALPSIERAALDQYGPHGSRFMAPLGVPGGPMPIPVSQGGSWESLTQKWSVTPEWFELFGMQPVRGRTFEDADWRVPPAEVTVLTASVARRLFGSIDVVGRVVVEGGRRPVERRVVGVVGDYVSLNAPSRPTDAFFVPYGDRSISTMAVLARTRGSAPEAAAEVRGVLESQLPEIPVPDPAPLMDRVENLRTEERVLGVLLGTLSAFALLMSAVGLYGVLYFVVSSRTKELGIRVALGADAARLLRVVGRSAMAIIAGGAVLGVSVAYALSRVLQSQLFGVGTLDLASYLGAAALLTLVALVASVAPARAALGVDPVATLREE